MTTATFSPPVCSAAGREPITSPSPPVLAKGAASEATIRIRAMSFPSYPVNAVSSRNQVGKQPIRPGHASRKLAVERVCRIDESSLAVLGLEQTAFLRWLFAVVAFE